MGPRLESFLASKILCSRYRKTWICAGFGGQGGVLLFFLEVGQLSLAFGQWAGKSVLTMLPPDLGFTGRLRVTWFPRNPVFVAGYHTPLSLPSALARGPQLFCGARVFKLAEMISGQPVAFFKLRNLAFFPFVAYFSHLKRALRHFKPVNGRALCAARWHLEP